MRFHGDRVVSRACVSGVTPPKPRDISSRITTRRTNQICCSRDRNRSCRRAGRARACSRKDRRGVGSITLNTITTAHFVSIRDVTAAKNTPRIVESRRSFWSQTCCSCSRDLSCRRASRVCACATRGSDWKAGGSRLMRSQPPVSCRVEIRGPKRRKTLKLSVRTGRTSHICFSRDISRSC